MSTKTKSHNKIVTFTQAPKDSNPKDCPAGSGMFVVGSEDQITALLYTCPCGCGCLNKITISPLKMEGTHQLTNSDLTKPSLSPHIKQQTPCGWLGQLKLGVWRMS